MVRGECEPGVRKDDVRGHPRPYGQPLRQGLCLQRLWISPSLCPKWTCREITTQPRLEGPLRGRKGGTRKGAESEEPDPAHLCFQGVLGAGYQALRLAQALLAGQELMLRGLHWFV